jgi:hypothetical protein
MTRGAGDGKPDCVRPALELIDEGANTTGRGQSCLPRCLAGECVHVESTSPELTELLDHLDI